jgi:hypothetical protein
MVDMAGPSWNVKPVALQRWYKERQQFVSTCSLCVWHVAGLWQCCCHVGHGRAQLEHEAGCTAEIAWGRVG